MLNIDEISDYRDLLKNYYTQRKLEMPLYSYKMLGQKLSLETSQVFRVLNKELHLPNRSIPLAKDLLDLKGRSGEIFEILVAASKTKSPAKKDKLYKISGSGKWKSYRIPQPVPEPAGAWDHLLRRHRQRQHPEGGVSGLVLRGADPRPLPHRGHPAPVLLQEPDPH